MIPLLLAAVLVAQERVPSEQVEQLVDQLAAEFEADRVRARKDLEKMGASAEPQLIDGLKKKDFRIRRGCLELLTVFKSAKAVEPAAGLFRSTQEERTVRQAAFECLRAAGKAAEDVLIEALDCPEAKWRRDALQTLTDLKSEKCAEKVAAIYDHDPDFAIKEAAFRCLQNIGKPAQPFLLKLLGSQDSTVRRGAIAGLKNIGASSEEILAPVSKLFLVESSPEALDAAFDLLKQAGAKAEPTFLDGLKSPQEATRRKSIQGLKDLKSEAALEPLGSLLEKDPSEGVRSDACEFLADFGLKAEDAFIRALHSSDVKIRLMAIAKLGGMGSKKAYPEIAEIFRKDADTEAHNKAFEYLKTVGIMAEKELLLALKEDKSPAIRMDAITALGEARSEAAVPILIEIVTDLTPEIHDKAIDALVKIGPKAIAAVDAAVKAGAVKKKDADTILSLCRQEQVESLLRDLVTSDGGSGFYEGQFVEIDKVGKDIALPILIQIATDPEYRWRRKLETEWQMKELAILAVGVLGDGTAAPALKKAFEGRTYSPGDDYAHYVVALFRLGEKQPYEELVKSLGAEASAKLGGDERDLALVELLSLGGMRSRAGDREGALETYLKLIGAAEEDKIPYCDKCGKSLEKDKVDAQKRCKECKTPVRESVRYENYCSALYNAACLYALRGDKAKALDYLDRAVDAGFKDREWIRRDGDLDGLRGEDRFKKLMADDKRFEKPASQ